MNNWSGSWFKIEEWVRNLIPDAPVDNVRGPTWSAGDEVDDDDGGGEDDDDGEGDDDTGEGEDDDDGEGGEGDADDDDGEGDPDDDGDGEGEADDDDDGDDGEGDDGEGDDGGAEGVPDDPRVPATIQFAVGARHRLVPCPGADIDVLEFEIDDLVARVRERVAELLTKYAGGRKQVVIRLTPMVLNEDANPIPWDRVPPLIEAFNDNSPRAVAPPPVAALPTVPGFHPPTPTPTPPPAFQPQPVFGHTTHTTPPAFSPREHIDGLSAITQVFMGHITNLIGHIQDSNRTTIEIMGGRLHESQRREAEIRAHNDKLVDRLVSTQLERGKVEAEGHMNLLKYEREVEERARRALEREAQEAQARLVEFQKQQARLEKQMRESTDSDSSEELKAQMAQNAMAMMSKVGEYLFKDHNHPPPPAAPPPAAPTPQPAPAAEPRVETRRPANQPPGAPRRPTPASGGPVPVPEAPTPLSWAETFAAMTPAQQREALQVVGARLDPQATGHLAEAMVDVAAKRQGGGA